jgi:hypothetical protein
VFTARYALSPYIEQIRFVSKRLILGQENVSGNVGKAMRIYVRHEMQVGGRLTVLPSNKT